MLAAESLLLPPMHVEPSRALAVAFRIATNASTFAEQLPELVGMELARDPNIRKALYAPMVAGLKEEKIALAGVMARSGDKDSIAPLRQLANDPDPAVSQEAMRAATLLEAR